MDGIAFSHYFARVCRGLERMGVQYEHLNVRYWPSRIYRCYREGVKPSRVVTWIIESIEVEA